MTLGCTVFIQETFLFTHAHIYTCMHMHTPIHLHAQTHYSDAHTTCEKVSLRLLPKSHQKSPQSTLVLFTPPPCFCLFRLFYAIQNTLPISSFKFSLPALPEVSCHSSTVITILITVISHIFPKGACYLLSGAIWIIWCCKWLKSYDNMNTACF